MDLSAAFNSLAEGEDEGKEKTEPEEKTEDVKRPENPVVVMAGSMDWARAVKGAAGKIKAKTKTEVEPEQFSTPTVLGGLSRVASIATGPSAGHFCFVGQDGKVWVMGLNANGQLGLPEVSATVVRAPVFARAWTSNGGTGKKVGREVNALKAVKAAVGKNHTLVLLEDGSVMSAGCGSRGALGRGTKKKNDSLDVAPAPGRVAFPGNATRAAEIAAGCDFSLAVTRDGSLYSWGWSEFGKLGHGTDGSYNTKASSIKMTYTAVAEPARVRLPLDDNELLQQSRRQQKTTEASSSEESSSSRRVVQCSAGKHHAACVCSDGVGFTWGDGAYGKLGHRSQEMLPTPTRLREARFTVIQCGDSSTSGLGYPEYRGRPFVKPPNQHDGMLYVWGVLKGTHGEGATHPRAEQELSGWTVNRSNLAMGASHLALHADDAAIAWAQSPVAFGQLGYGRSGPKSSHKPQKLNDLDGLTSCLQVSAHAGATLFLFDKAKDDKKVLDKLDVWTPPTGDDVYAGGEAEDDDDDAAAGSTSKKPASSKKRGKAPAASSSSKKKARAS